MKNYTKALIAGCFLTIGGMIYAGSTYGWGVTPLKSHKTMQELKKDCPNQYVDRNGECLRSSFRSIYFLRSGYGGFTGK